jgi:hypothetical protein
MIDRTNNETDLLWVWATATAIRHCTRVRTKNLMLPDWVTGFLEVIADRSQHPSSVETLSIAAKGECARFTVSDPDVFSRAIAFGLLPMHELKKYMKLNNKKAVLKFLYPIFTARAVCG